MLIFNFILLKYVYLNTMIIIPIFIALINIWIFFIRNNFYSIRINPSSIDVLKHSKIIKKLHYIFYMFWLLPFILILYLTFYYIKFDINVHWFNHLKFNNFLLNIIIIILINGIIITNIIKFIKSNNINFNVDYFISISNLITFIPVIYITNTFYTFLFVLETISILIIYKFAVSKFFFKDQNFFDKAKNTFEKNLSKNYINMLFFQYWANFFSSIILFFFVFNIIYIYGLSDWLLLNYFNKFNLNFNIYENKILILFLMIIFLSGFFLKIGFTPTHLFKIEVYKGIPFISIFFYTTIYFLSFFLYFIMLLYYNINSFTIFMWLFFSFFLFTGLFYVISLLFDVNTIKSFFAYSTVVNTLSFLIVMFVSIC